MSTGERREIEEALQQAAAIRAKVLAQLDDEEIQAKLQLADKVIWLLDHWKFFAAAGGLVLSFTFWLGVTVGKAL